MSEVQGDGLRDCRVASEREAERALREDQRVYAPETSDGELGQVHAIEPLTIEGKLTPAVSIRFVSGHVRVSGGAQLFYVGPGPCRRL
jgi:hypothetical protein